MTSRYTGLPAADARRRARADVLEYRGMSVVNADTGRTIQLSAAGLKHATVGGARSPADYELARHIPEIVRGMAHEGTESDRSGRRTIRQVHLFAAFANVDDVTHRLRVVVRETVEGDFFYDSHAVADGGPDAMPSTDGRGPSRNSGQSLPGRRGR